eukprot:scaffold4489_cov30-Phaeocystis_antarctica.AAC.1
MAKVYPTPNPSPKPNPSPRSKSGQCRAAQHSQAEAGPLGAQPLPRVLELAACKAADFAAF